MLKISQKNTIIFSNLSEKINYQSLIETHGRKIENEKKRSRYRRSDSEIERILKNNKLFKIIVSEKDISEKKIKIQEIINKGADVNFEIDKKTMLHWAIKKDELEIVNFLLTQGADITIKNGEGKTPIELAKELNHQQIVAILEDHIKLKPQKYRLATYPAQHSAANPQKIPRLSTQSGYLEQKPGSTNEEKTPQGIDKYLTAFSLTNKHTWSTVDAKKEETHFKILKITDSKTAEDALRFMQQEPFLHTFNQATHWFFTVIAVDNALELKEKDLEPLATLLDAQKPMIIQWGSPGSAERLIFFKQPGESTFTQFTLSGLSAPVTDEQALIEKLSSRGSFQLPLLLRALHSGLGGHFNGDLLQVTVDVNQEFDTWRLIDYAARDDDSLSLRFLLLTDWDLAKKNENLSRVLEIAAEHATPKSLSALLNLPITRTTEELFLSSQQKELLALTDAHGNTPFLIAAQRENTETLRFLSHCGADIHYQRKIGEPVTAIKLAWDKKRYGNVLALLKADSPFPSGFDTADLQAIEQVAALKTLVERRKTFHKALTEGAWDTVKAFIKDHPRLKQGYNPENQPALTTALQAEQYEIYAFLQSKGFEEDKLLSITSEQNNKLKLAKLKYFKKQDNAHITYLLSKSRLGFGQEKDDFYDTIKKLYEQLDTIPEISTVLKVVEQSKATDIIFDFSKDSITDLDPTQSSATAGACDFREGRIYIGAKQASEGDLLGTLAHELTHLAMQIRYNNDCNPYEVSDKEKQSEFDKIVEKYRNEKNIDPIIQRVFTVYKNPADWPSELIARVPHLLARDQAGQNKEQLTQQAQDLFGYYNKQTRKELEIFIDKPNYFNSRHQVQRLNNLLGQLDKIEKAKIWLNSERLLSNEVFNSKAIQLLSSSLPQLTRLNLYQVLSNNKSLSDIKSNYIFTVADQFRNPEQAQHIFNAFQSNTLPTLIIECSYDYEFSQQDLWSIIDSFREKKRIIFIADTNIEQFLKKNLKKFNPDLQKDKDYRWSDLTLSSQQKLLEKTVNFQGSKVILNKLISSESPLTKLLPLADLLEEKPLEIDKPLPISSGYDEASYIGRTFHPYIEINQSILNDKKSHDSLAYSEKEFKQLCEKYPVGNIHWLKREPGQPLVWRQSRGDLTALRQHMNVHQMDTHHLRSYPPEDLNSFLHQARHRKMMLIADTAGMGKSTVLTHLSKQIKQASPTHWVGRIDLNDHTDALQAHATEKMEAVEFLSEKLLTLDSPLEKNLFKQHLEAGKVVLMLDGFDEISPSYKETVIDLLQALKKTPVEQLWVTTRPHLRQALEDKLQQLSYTLEPFSEENQIEFLTQFWRQQLTLQKDYQDRLAIYSKALIQKLTQSIHDEEKVLTGIPLQTRMLAESFKDELQTFLNSDKTAPDLSENLDLLALYEKFFDKKFDIYQEEKNKTPLNNVGAQEQRARDNKNIWKKHQQLALQVLLTKEQVDLLKQNIPSEFSEEAVARIGIINYVDKKPYFIHRTFAEYFLSRFIVENLSEPTVQIFLLKEILIQDNHQISRKFLNSHFSKKLPGEALLKVYGKHISKTWPKTWLEILSNKINNDKTFLTIAAKENNSEILLFLLKSLKEYPETLKRIITDNEVAPLQIAASYGHREFVEVFLSFYQDKENSWPGTTKKLVLSKNNEGISLLQNAAINYQLEFIKWFLDYVKNKVEPKLPGTLEKLVISTKNDKFTPLHLAGFNGHLEVVKLLINKGANINATNEYKETPLYMAIINGHLEVVKFLIDQGADINATDEDKETPLYMAIINGHLEVVKFLIDQGADINGTDEDKETTLHWAAQSGHLEVVKFLIDQGANIETTDKNKWTPLYWAAQSGHLEVVKFLIDQGADINATDEDKETPLHWAAQSGHLEVVKFLIDQGADINATNKNKETPLYLAILTSFITVKNRQGPTTPNWSAYQGKQWAIAVTLLKHGAKITDLSDKECRLLREHVESGHYEGKEQILQSIEKYLLTSSISRLGELRAQSESLGLELVEDATAGCRLSRRRRRELGACAEGEERDSRVFPYEPLEERAPVEQRQAARLYGQLGLAAAWKQRESPDSLLRYQRYLGEILEEGEANQSPREQQLLRAHYQQAFGFFQNHPKPTLLETQADDFEPLAGHSVLLESGQQSLLVFNEGPRYQLYSPDFNYRQRFHTRPGVSWSKLSAFVQAFFQWKTGSRNYHALALKDLPEETLKALREAPFWKPEDLAPDSVLLAREHSGEIEGIPAEVVKELIRVNGQGVEANALHTDFFQHTAGIQLRVENLHTVLEGLTLAQRRALVRVVQKYQWSADNTLLESLDADAQPLFADYQQQVMTELKTAETLTPERLSEFSWQAMGQAFDKHPDIFPELTQQALTHLKELQATTAKRAWAKGMVTQTLFFLPDMIRAVNTGQVDGLVRMGGMLAADSTVNHLYGNLLERLTPTLSEARLGLLRKLPITSPVFKALTVYSIVELTKQLQSLPADSEQRATIKHCLEEQYVTAGLMVAELFGWELGPLWVVLIAEQQIFEAITFRKENQLDIPFWEAFIMNLGFEQDKLQHILEERQLVDLNLATVNNINTQAQPPYGLVLVRVPTLGPLTWNDIDESQVPPEIKQQVLNQPEPLLSFISNTVIREAGGFRQIREDCGNVQAVNSSEAPIRGRLVKSYWKRGEYKAQAAAINVHWAPSGRQSHQEDNIFRQELTIPQGVKSTFERLVSVAGRDYQAVVAHSPIQITGEGLAALYAVKQPPATAASKKNLYLGFDPREGDICLEMHSSGWNHLTSSYRGAPTSTSLTVQVGPKSYPSAILFQSELGILRVEDKGQRRSSSYFISFISLLEDKSQRLQSNYVISSDSAPFYLHDDTLTNRIAISPPRDRPIGFIVRSYDQSIIQLQIWSPNRSSIRPDLPPLPTDRNPVELKRALQALLPQQISTLHLPNKQYLQLMLQQQLIAGVLTLAAEQVEVLYAKGQEAYQSGIFMTASVTNFTVTLLGHLQIMQGSTHLFFIGETPDKDEPIRYSKNPSAPHLPVYQLELPALQPVLESLSRPNPQEIQFSTPGLNYAWVPGVEHPSALKIMGPYQGQPAQLLLEHQRSILSELTGQRPRRLVVDHYNPHATLDSQLVLQQVIPGGGESHLAYLDGRCDSLLFQSAEGYSVIHRFPAQQTLTLNGIDYQVIGKQLYAIGAPNGVIDGEQLIRTRTANRRVAIRLNSSLAESTLSRDQDTLTINQLTLRHLPNQTPIYLSEQAFPLKALKESIHRQRHRRELPSAKPLASGAAQNKPWGNQLMKQVVTLLGGVHWEWPTLFSWGNSMSQKPAILNSGQPTPKGLQTVGEYTVGHLQGGLQLVDLLVRKITGERYQQLATCAPTPLTEAEARLASLQQQYASFSSHDNLAANPYRGHRVDMLSTPQWTATPINRD